MEEEGTVDIVIVGAGISGLSTAVGLDRYVFVVKVALMS